MRKLNNIFLTGFMGSGKSTLGPLLAKETRLNYLDTDGLIETREGKTIAEIFTEDGEAKFRDREAKLIKELCDRSGNLVSLGGGSLGVPETRALLLESGLLIYLKANIETLLARTDGSDRPLLAGLSPSETHQKMHQLMADREGDYRKAHLIQSVEGLNPDQIVVELRDKIEAWLQSK